MPGGASGGPSTAAGATAWAPALKGAYRDFITSKKSLSDNSIHSYCWRVENLIKAVANGKDHVSLPICTKQELKQLIETNLSEARALVKQDDRQSHFDLLKRMLDIVEVRTPLAALEDGERGKPEAGKAAAAGRDKAWDPEVRQNYRIWLRSRGIKDRTCGSYCSYVNSLLLVLLDKDSREAAGAASGPENPEQPAGGAQLGGSRGGPLKLEQLKQLLLTHAEAANAQVKKSKKTRYLRSFREFLGLVKPSTVRKVPRVWSDRFGAEYKQWLGRNGMAENGRARSKGYLGAARSMLRIVRKQEWVAEDDGRGGEGGVTRQAVAAAIDSHRAELSELCDKADGERVGAFLEFLQASEEEVRAQLVGYPLGVDNDGDSDDDDEEDDEEAGEGRDDREGRAAAATETESVGTSAAMDQAAMPGASSDKGSRTGKSRENDADSSRVKKLQKRVRELEARCAEKQNECDTLRAKVARLEHDLQRLRPPPPAQPADVSTVPSLPELPASAVFSVGAAQQDDVPELVRIRDQMAALQATFNAIVTRNATQQPPPAGPDMGRPPTLPQEDRSMPKVTLPLPSREPGENSAAAAAQPQQEVEVRIVRM